MTRATQSTLPGAAVTAYSGNSKIGAAHTVSVTQESCSSDCPLKYAPGTEAGSFPDGPCYFSSGRNTGTKAKMLWASGSDQDHLDIARNAARLMERLPADLPLRLFEGGDLHCQQCADIIAAGARSFIKRCKRAGTAGKAWGYTHSWRFISADTFDSSGLSVLASCETADDVAQAKAAGWATALVEPIRPDRKRYTNDQGVAVIPCPSQPKDSSVTCSSCKLCMRPDFLKASDVSIGFYVHGSRKNKAATMLATRRQTAV